MTFEFSFASILNSMNINEAQVIESETLANCEDKEIVQALQLMTTLAMSK